MIISQWNHTLSVCLIIAVATGLLGCSESRPTEDTIRNARVVETIAADGSPLPIAERAISPSEGDTTDDVPAQPLPDESDPKGARAAAKAPEKVDAAEDSRPPRLDAPSGVIPATVREAVAAIDLAALPILPETQFLSRSPISVEYYAGGNVASIAAFYQAELTQRGWKELTPPADESINVPYQETVFGKDGFHVKLTIGDSGDDGEVVIQLTAMGNVDARTLPVVDKAISQNSGVPSSASYLCSTDVATVAGQCRQLLAEHGWHEFRPFGPRQPKTPGFVDMSWCQNGVMLFAYVSSTPQFQNGRPILSYHLNGMLPFDMPLMADATDLQLESHSPRYEYISPSKPAQIAEFYQQAYEALGWKPREVTGVADSEGLVLGFQRDDELAVHVHLIPREEGGCRVALARWVVPTDGDPGAESSLSSQETSPGGLTTSPADLAVPSTDPEAPADVERSTPAASRSADRETEGANPKVDRSAVVEDQDDARPEGD